MVGCAFRRDGRSIRSGAFHSGISWEVNDMLQRLMYPKTGWVILHAVAVFLMLLLGYVAKF
jgi:hypothetical protein